MDEIQKLIDEATSQVSKVLVDLYAAQARVRFIRDQQERAELARKRAAKKGEPTPIDGSLA